MGYAASMLYGEDIVLPAEKHDEVWDGLFTVQEVLGTHISWCSPLPDYRENGASATAAIKQVLEDYGFERVAIAENGNIVIPTWGGDKLGSCWEGMWKYIIAPFTLTDLTWVMQGEDSVIWVEAVRNNQLVPARVTTTVQVEGEKEYEITL